MVIFRLSLILGILGLLLGCGSPRKSNRLFTRDIRLSAVQVGGFRLGMTPTAAQRIAQARGYTEDLSNRMTFTDLDKNQAASTYLHIQELVPKDTKDQYIRLLSEQSSFTLEFLRGRIVEIQYTHSSITEEALQSAMRQYEAEFSFVQSKTNSPNWTSWEYSPEDSYANARLDFYTKPNERVFGFPQCSYQVMIRDQSWSRP